MFKSKISKKNSTKGVAPVIGFLLVMAIIFLAAGQFQANVVPVQEQEEEANHFNKVVGDLSGLRTDIIKSSSNGQLQTQRVRLGMTYDTLGITQSPVAGTLTLNDTREQLPANSPDELPSITIFNAENNGVASNYWTGDQEREYPTGILSYSVDYNRFARNPDLFMEHGYLYRDTIKDDDQNINMIPVSEQPIINSNKIQIYTLQSGESSGPSSDGSDLSVNQIRPVTIESNPTSAPMNSVSITNDDSENIIIKLPTRLEATHWREVFETQKSEVNSGQCTSSDKHIKSISDNSNHANAINITMCQGITYNLQMSRIDVQSRSSRGLIPPTEEAYIAVDDDKVVNVREKTLININGEVRDRYNNGVVGVPVGAEAKSTNIQECVGDFPRKTASQSPTCNNNNNNAAQPGKSVSDANGDISFVYKSPEVDSDQEVTFTYRFLN